MYGVQKIINTDGTTTFLIAFGWSAWDTASPWEAISLIFKEMRLWIRDWLCRRYELHPVTKTMWMIGAT